MKEEKTPDLPEGNDLNANSIELQVVDVGLDDDEADSEELDLTENAEAEKERPIPEEWKGKPEAEIALLFEIQDLKENLSNLEKESFDKYARLQAEFENFRRRSLKDKNNYYKYASAEIISKLLPILDSAELMLKSLKERLDPKDFEGVQMLFKELFGVLEKEGLTPIQAEGQLFDPFVHEIITLEYTDECPEETILEVFQKGYRLKDRVLRPCKVKISKKQPKEEPKPDSELEEEK